MVRYGRFATSDPDWGTIPAGVGRACTYRNMTENGWGTSVGGHLGRVNSGDNPTVRFGIYETSSGNPTSRMAYTAVEAITALMDHGGSGDAFTASIASVDDNAGPSNDGVMLYSGRAYAIAVLPSGASVNHGMIQSGSISETIEMFYYRTGAGSIPPDPYGQTSSSLEGWMSLWINYEPNVAPDVPTNRSPSGTISSTTPSFGADFNDDNSDCGDVIKQYQIQLRQVGTTANKWDSSYTASNSEQDAERITRAYGGTALVSGNSYEWRIRMSDQFGAWSGWSSWLSFTVSGGGTVTISGGTPSGRQEAITGLVFQARWTHVSGLNMDRAQIRLLQGGVVIGTSGEITGFNVASSTAPGTLFSINQVQSSIFNAIIWGQSYQYQVRGRATNGIYSDWSNTRSFNIDAKPNNPDKFFPTGLKPTATLPMLTCTMSDPDDTYATGLRCYARISGQFATSNWDFGLDTVSWSLGTSTNITRTFTRDVTQYVSSPASGKLTISGNTAGVGGRSYVINGDIHPCVPGQSYTIHGDFRGDSANMTPRFMIDWFTAADVFISGSDMPDWTPIANSWASKEFTAIAPANAAKMRAGFFAYCDIANPVGNIWVDNWYWSDGVRYDRLMSLQAGATIDWEYQTVAADIPAYGTYSWTSYGWDGSVYGDPASPFSQFKYQLGPSVSIVSPTSNQILETSTPLIDWTASSQTKYRVDIYLNDGVTVLYTSGDVVDTATQHLVPPGYLLNGFKCVVYVTVWDTGGIDGTSSGRSFSIEFPPVDFVIGVEISTVTLRFDHQPSAILLSWEHTDYAPEEFEFYSIYRRESSQTDAERLLLRKATSPSQVTFLDAHPVSDVEYVYGISQTILVGSENLEGATTDVAASIHLHNTIINSVDDPDDTRVSVKFWSSRGWEDVTDGTDILPWGASKPTVLFGSVYYRTIGLTARFITDQQGSIKDYETAVNSILARRGIVCIRDPKGRRAFGVLKRTTHDDQAMGTLSEIEFEITETNFTEGVR